MSLSWSGPIPCREEYDSRVPEVPVVYRARLTRDGTTAREINRFWGTDKDGVLLIGESVTGKTRFRELREAIFGQRLGRGHGPGFTFHHWFSWTDAKPENVVFEWCPLGDSAAAHGRDPKSWVKAGELLLLEHYRGVHGDLPPCNTQGPKWNAVVGWLKNTYDIHWAYDPTQTARLNIPEIAVPGVPAMTVAQARAIPTRR